MRKKWVYYVSLFVYFMTIGQSQKIKDPIGQTVYDEQMHGVAEKSAYFRLQKDIDVVEFNYWLAPGESLDTLIFNGIRRWKDDQTFLGVACFADNIEDAKYERKYQSTKCGQKFYVGLYKIVDHKFIPKAKTKYFLQEQMENDYRIANKLLYETLDLAPYKISNDEMAFGIRVSSSEGFSAGGAYFQNLLLLRIVGDELNVIFNQPVYAFINLAGEWIKDETGEIVGRDRDVEERSTKVIMLPKKTNGYYNIELRTDNVKEILYWSEDKKFYQLKI